MAVVVKSFFENGIQKEDAEGGAHNSILLGQNVPVMLAGINNYNHGVA